VLHARHAADCCGGSPVVPSRLSESLQSVQAIRGRHAGPDVRTTRGELQLTAITRRLHWTTIPFRSPVGHDAVNAPEAWEAGVRGPGVRVAVLDSGVDGTHPTWRRISMPVSSTSFLSVPLPNNWNFHGIACRRHHCAADMHSVSSASPPEAEIVSVQLRNGGCPSSPSCGLVYAADNGAT